MSTSGTNFSSLLLKKKDMEFDSKILCYILATLLVLSAFAAFFLIPFLLKIAWFQKCKNGVLKDDECICDTGWGGELCDIKHTEFCNYRGYPNADGQCMCDKGWTGNYCNESCVYYPKPNIGPNEVCDEDTGEYKCKPGWHGLNCMESCVHDFDDCSKTNQQCNTDTGECEFLLPSCSSASDCPENATCDESKQQCVCDPEWTGPQCKEPNLCGTEDACVNGGYCVPLTGACKCPLGYYGTWCEYQNKPETYTTMSADNEILVVDEFLTLKLPLQDVIAELYNTFRPEYVQLLNVKIQTSTPENYQVIFNFNNKVFALPANEDLQTWSFELNQQVLAMEELNITLSSSGLFEAQFTPTNQLALELIMEAIV